MACCAGARCRLRGSRGCFVEELIAFALFCPRYRYGQLIEINSHSLFSKWFSEVSVNVNSVLRAVDHTVGRCPVHQTLHGADHVARRKFQSHTVTRKCLGTHRPSGQGTLHGLRGRGPEFHPSHTAQLRTPWGSEPAATCEPRGAARRCPRRPSPPGGSAPGSHVSGREWAQGGSIMGVPSWHSGVHPRPISVLVVRTAGTGRQAGRVALGWGQWGSSLCVLAREAGRGHSGCRPRFCGSRSPGAVS